MDYERLERRLESVGVDIGLAEMHGRMASVVCSVPDLKQSQRLQLASDWLAVDRVEQDILVSLDANNTMHKRSHDAFARSSRIQTARRTL